MSDLERGKFLTKAKRLWLQNPDNPVKFAKAELHKYLLYQLVHDELAEFMIDYLVKRYESMLIQKKIALVDIEIFATNQPVNQVYFRLLDMIAIWLMTYDGPEGSLKKIAADSQSIHMPTIARKTDSGIKVLEAQEVPKGQKTLDEIRAVFIKMNRANLVEKVMDDMKDWGSRGQVMNPTENTYKKVLRGLWAKIKSFDGEIKLELIKRLWEECYEAVGLCADGHVGRLVNVLVGFDEQFKVEMSPMEYFQNNMSQIANSDVPHSFKLEHAKKLMDEIQMSQEDRAAWLDAL